MTTIIIAAIALVFGASVASAEPSGTPTADASAALDGRLGGSRESFEARYGPSVPSGIDVGFTVEGFGLVQVQFGGNDESGPAIVITLRSPRPAALPATTPDDADWTLAQARRRVARFLPEDVELGGPKDAGPQAATLACRSDTIAAAFGELGSGAGDCRVAYVMPTPDSVSFATLVLAQESGEPDAAPDDPCDGMVAWSQATGARLGEADALLGGIAALNANAPDAGDALAAAAARFDALTEAQRSDEAPAAAATANYYLIAGFKAYGDALDAAAAAVVAGDAQAAAAAAVALTDAGATIASGVRELQASIADCGLEAATPTA